MAKQVVPPPIVLDDDWEHANVDAPVVRPESGSDPLAATADGKWRQQRAYRAGSLRIYTLSGLQPSTTSRLGRAGLGFGESKVMLLISSSAFP